MDVTFVSSIWRMKWPTSHLRACAPRRATEVFMRAASSYGVTCVESMRRFETTFADENEEANVIPIEAVSSTRYASWLEEQPEAIRGWLRGMKFTNKKPGAIAIVPSFGSTDRSNPVMVEKVVLAVCNECGVPWTYADLPKKLPSGVSYRLTGDFNENAASLGWALGTYEFKKFKQVNGDDGNPEHVPRLCLEPSSISAAAAASTFLARDLINFPAQDMCPADLEAAVRALGDLFQAETQSVIGDELLDHNFPMIHAVGRAAASDRCQPRLIEMRWNSDGLNSKGSPLPLITLIGKGVCYDTGGLDLKPAASMRNMKKDMGGAANVLGLAAMIMSNRLRVRLHLLIPAVENAIGGNAYRPGDILTSRAGITMEVDNTDAEGRIVLADTITYACEEKPQLLIDCATLTGAQRVALGTEIPGSFCNDEALGRRLHELSRDANDLIWELPLHRPYRRLLDSSIAQIKNASAGGYAGAITAALFLEEFVGTTSDAPQWIHIDHMGYNVSSQPGRPEGGEANGLRALFDLIRSDFSSE